MLSKHMILLPGLLALAAVRAPTAAQAVTPLVHQDRIWFGGGVGLGGSGSSTKQVSIGFSAAVGVTYQPSTFLMTLRSTGVFEVFRGSALADIALLAGVGTRQRTTHASIAVGPALVSGDLDAFQGPARTFNTRLGLGVQAQWMAIPITAAGLGVTAFANLNHRQSYGGFVIALYLGQLR